MQYNLKGGIKSNDYTLPIHPLNSERKVESHENQYFHQILGFIKGFSEEVTFKLRSEG